MRGCLSEDELLSIASGGLDAVVGAGLAEHLASCDGCAGLVAQVARERHESVAGGDADVAPASGARVGRYVLLELTTVRGTGRVYAAWDPDLDRKVALELLPPASGVDPGLARLAHPNVVAVHEVGAWEGGRFVAREVVRGQTLRAWLGAEPRRWQEIVAAYAQAGRGVAAAHRAGLAYGDFDPSHVLVRSDGRVAVTVPGLARVDVRGDVCSFCVALNEALANRPIPARLRRAVQAGLARDPAARPASMEALLAPLEAAPRRTRLGLVGGAAILVAASAAGLASRQGPSPAPAPVCEDAEAELAGVWDPARRQSIRAAMLRTGAPGADLAAAAVERAFDGYAARWREAWTDACARGSASLDARTRCLDDRARAWRALGDALAQADAASVDRAAGAVAYLPSPDRCADPRHLEREPAAPALVARHDALRDRIAKADAAVRLGRDAQAALELTAGLEEARALHSPAMEAELLLLEGERTLEADPLHALASFHAAARAAEGAGRDDLLARARLRVTDVLGSRPQRAEDALQWARYAQIPIERLGDAELAAELARARGDVHARAGNAELALPRHQEALAYFEAHAAGPDLRVARGLFDVAIDLAYLDRADESLATFRRSLGVYEELYGPDHPRTLTIRADYLAAVRRWRKPR